MGELDRFNGEDIKLYVTKNKGLPTLLKNTGSLIVMKNSEDGINYTYLGNELLGGGYGFPSREHISNLSYVSSSYNGIIESLSYNIETSYGLSYAMDQALLSKIEARLSSTSNISDNYVQIEDKYNGFTYHIPMSLAVEVCSTKAEYTKADISIDKYSISFTEWPNDTSATKTIDSKVDVMEVPVGATIKNMSVVFKAKDNDTGGIKSFTTTVAYYADDTFTEQDLAYVNYNKMNYTTQEANYYLVTNKVNYEEKKDTFMFAKEGTTTIIPDISVNFYGTPDSKLKPYPQLATKWSSLDNAYLAITCSETRLKDYTESLGSLSIVGYHRLFVYQDTSFDIEDYFGYSGNGVDSTLPKTVFYSKGKEMILLGPTMAQYLVKSDIVSVALSAVAKRTVIAVPYGYKIQKAYLVIDNEMSDFTGFLKYNDEGSYLKIGENAEAEYRFYEMYNSQVLTNDGTLYLRLVKISETNLKALDEEDASQSMTFTKSYNSQLNDEVFNSMYIVNGQDCESGDDEFEVLVNFIKKQHRPRTLS